MPRAPMPRPTAWPRAALAALFMAFALTTLAPDNAAAQTAVPDTLDFGTITLSNGVVVNLNLIAPVTTGTGDTVYTFTHVDGTGEKVVTVTGGKTYYFLDAGGGGTAEAGQIGQGGDSFAVADMKLFFADSVTDISDTQDGNHDGGLDERSYTIGGGSTGGGSTLVLPTVAEWEVLRASAGGVPEGWLGTSNRYASSSPGRPGGAADNYNYQLGHSETVDGPGTSPYSDNEGLTRLLVAVQVIAPTAPAVPTGVTATNGNGESVVTWEPVPEADNGGSAVISYTATAINNVDNNDFFTCTADGADADTCTIMGLANGTEYSIVVFATNSVDNSLDSTAVTATPGVPAPPTVTLVAGPMQIEVSWTAPTDIGASAITGYICEYFIPGMGRVGTIDVDATATACTITGLTDNTRYRVIVRATNSHGSSAASANAYAIPSDIRLPDVDDQDYTVGQTVAFTLPEAIGGTPPYTYTIAGQALARFPGLTFTASERTITGTPTATESRTIRYRATDSTTGGVNPNVAEASFTITVVDAAELRFTETVAERIYPIDISQGNRVPAVTPGLLLPEAEGGITPRSYTLNPDISNFTGGALRFNPASRRISQGSPTQTASQVFIYTAHDGTAPTPQTASLTFKISTVEVAGDGTAVTDVDGTALAVDDVGTTDHNLRLFMPADHAATTFRVTTYTPDPATPPDGGYIFSGVAMDIDLRPGSADSIPTGTEATVCLSTTGVQPSYEAALFLGTTGGLHVQGVPNGWVSIGSEIRTRGGDRYVCGETSEFAPYFAVASKTTGPAIILTPTTRTLAEGSTTTYTVALATMPTVDVTVTITDHAGTDVTPDMTTLTFTTGTWGTAQTVTLTAREDADAVDDDVTLTHTASGGDYGGGSVTAITADFTATVTENDAVGLTLTPGALTFAEGGTATYTVTLNSQPTTDVALTIASSNTDVTPNQNTLTFAAGNWDTPQTVILTDAEADGDAVNDTVMLTHTASGGEYGSVTGTLTFTVTDDDAPGLILTPDALTLNEGTTATYTVRLNTLPTAMVTVTIADATTHVTPTPAALTFNTGDWNTVQTVTITAVQDDDAVNESVTLTHTAAGGDYASLSGNLAVNIEDDETRGLTLTPGALTMDEGGTATYTVRLDSEPTETVTVTVSGFSGTDFVGTPPSPATLTFTTTNWNEAQTVTLTDNEPDGADAENDTVILTHTASGGDYGGGDITAITADLTVTVTDDDIAFDGTIGTQTLNIHQTFTLTLPEATGVGVGTVTYTLTRVGSGEPLPPGLIFDGVARTISGVPTAVFGSAQLRYTAIDIASPAKTGSLGFLFFVVDERGISLSRTDVTLTEEDTDTYTVTLATQPTTDVMVTIDSGSTTDVTTNPTSLSFTTGNWDRAQTVTIMAVDDADMTTDSVMLTHTARGGDYTPALSTAATTASNLTVTVIDNDAPNLTLTPNILMLNEGGSGDTHTVALTTTPSAAVTVTITSDNTVTPTPAALTFTVADSSPQMVTLTAAEDNDAMNESATLTYTASGGASGTYNGVFGTVTVTVTDDDTPPMFPATTDIADRIYPATVDILPLTLPEAMVGTGTGTFSYTLVGAPTGLTFAGDTRILSGAPTGASASLTYTVTDSGSTLEDSLMFSVSVVTVSGDGTAVADGDGTALAVDDVGTTDHNLRLLLPDGHTVTTVKVTTYTPDPAIPPAGGYIFSGVAMDIDLGPGSSDTTIPIGTEATVCLSTTGVNGNTPALFLGTTGDAHVQDTPDGWVSIGSEIRTRGGDEYVCGETREFAPYFAVASMPPATTPPGTTSSITLSATTLTLAEGSTAIYTVVLNSKPSADVTVTITGHVDTDVMPDPTTLTFTTGNWGTTQTVTITAAGDTDTTNDTAILTHTASGGGYDNIPVDLIVTVTDTNTAPEFSDTALADAGIDDQTYTVVRGVMSSLTLPAVTGGVGTLNYTLVPDELPGLTFDPSNRTLYGMPTMVNTHVLTYTVTDSATDIDGNSEPQTASLTFNVMVVEQMSVGANILTPIALTLPSVTSDSGTAVTVLVTLPTENTVQVGVPLQSVLDVPPPPGIEFTSTAVDIDLVGISTLSASATVCLPTTAVPAGRVPVLYHYPSTGDNPSWNEIGRNTETPGFVCGTTDTFSTIRVGWATDDPEELNEQLLSRASQAMTASVSARVAARVEAAAGGSGGINSTGDPSALAYQFGGQSSMRGLLQAHGKTMLEGEMDYERLLDGASFVLPLSAAGDEGGGKLGGLSLWGGADFSNLDGDAGDLDWDGEVVSFHLGVDSPVGNNMLAGLALSLNTASFDYTDDGRSGDYDYTTTNLHPYLGYIHNEKLNFWGAAGLGQGEIEIKADNGENATDTTHLSLAGGFNNQILRSPGLLPNSVTTLSVKSDVSVVQVEVEKDENAGFTAQNIDSHHLRLLVSGEQRREFADGSSLAPSMEIGVRYDGGDGVTGSGIEVGTGVRYADPSGKLTLAGNVRSLQLDGYDAWGADFTVRLAPQSGRGLSLSLQPVWGQTQSTAERLWDEGAGELGGGDTALQSRMDSEVGYGLAATMLGSAGVLTPYAGMTTADGRVSHLRLGGRFAAGDGLSLKLEGARGNGDDASHTVLLRGELAF